MTIDSSATSTRSTPRVAFQGERGAFSEDAVVLLWQDAVPIPLPTFDDVTTAVSKGHADVGVLPVVNTIVGDVDAAREAIARATDLHVIGETILDIHQCLLGLPDAKLETIEVVESHPVALAQCTRFLSRLRNALTREVYDTAGAARLVGASGDPRRAAIASARAAGIYGLVVLAENIEDRADNQTRFLAVARKPVTPRATS